MDIADFADPLLRPIAEKLLQGTPLTFDDGMARFVTDPAVPGSYGNVSVNDAAGPSK